MIEVLFEALFEFVGEFLIEFFGELLVEAGLHGLSRVFRGPRNPWLAALGYAVLGSAIGGLSLVAFPRHFVSNQDWRLVNLLVTPLAVGQSMALVGAWRAKRGQQILRLDRFVCGWVFAFAFAVVRLFWAV